MSSWDLPPSAWEAAGRAIRMWWSGDGSEWEDEISPFSEGLQELEKAGYVIVPAGAVPTPEDRAAVGRLVELVEAKDAQIQSGHIPGGTSYARLSERVRIAREALQPGDIEAAQRVAEGGK